MGRRYFGTFSLNETTGRHGSRDTSKGQSGNNQREGSKFKTVLRLTKSPILSQLYSRCSKGSKIQRFKVFHRQFLDSISTVGISSKTRKSWTIASQVAVN